MLDQKPSERNWEMSRKLMSISFVLALLLSVIASSPGAASVETFGNRYGKVTAVSANSITIKNFDDVQKIILVDSATRYYRVTGGKRSLSDVKVGSWVFASGANDNSNTLAATTIILVTKKYAGAAYWNYRREYGTVTSVNPAYGVFFVKTDKSGTVRVIGYDATRFLNTKVNKVSKITVGMKVAVAGPVQSNGYILATAIIAFKAPRR